MRLLARRRKWVFSRGYEERFLAQRRKGAKEDAKTDLGQPQVLTLRLCASNPFLTPTKLT